MPTKLEELISELGEADRQERIELLIDLARDLPPLPERLVQFKDEAHRVPECQSPVFLFVEPEGAKLRLHADAPVEAPTVRGFVAMLVAGLDGESPQDVAAISDDILARSGLRAILGMQRSSGLQAVLRRLRAMATRTLEAQAPPPAKEPNAVDLDHDTLIAALRTVTDPELHVNVVDLGLVYGVQTKGDEVHVEMTLTSPACPAGPQILRDAVNALEKVDGVSKAHVKLVMNPPWSQDLMTDAARDELGIF